MDSKAVIPCPDPGCVDGVIMVCNAYSDMPLEGKAQPCDCCKGRGFIEACTSVIPN